jgi:hypothetical protein
MYDELDGRHLQELAPEELDRICGMGAGYDFFPHSASLAPLPLGEAPLF